MRPLAAILALPILEIALFVTIGGAIGLLATLLIIFGTAALGVFLLRRQGSRCRPRCRCRGGWIRWR